MCTGRKYIAIILAFPVLYSHLSCSDRVEKYSNGISYIQEGVDYNFVLKEEFKGFFLEPNIEQVYENNEYILFIQVIDKERLRTKIAGDLNPQMRYFDSIVYAIVDSVIHNSNHHHKQIKHKRAYWILEKEKDSLIGPFKSKINIEKYGFDLK